MNAAARICLLMPYHSWCGAEHANPPTRNKSRAVEQSLLCLLRPMLFEVLDSDGIIVPVAETSRGVLSSFAIVRVLSRTMRTSAQLLVVSPDNTLLQAVGRCAEAIGHTAFLTRSLSQARRTLTRVAIDLICLDSILPNKELERFSRWLSTDHQRANARVLLLAPPSATKAPASLPPLLSAEARRDRAETFGGPGSGARGGPAAGRPPAP